MNMSQANKGIIDIRGKSYRTVAFRVNEFRTTKDYDGWCINTDIIQQSEVECTMKCIVTDQNGAIRGTGIANEVKGAGNINKTSHIENCETSAIGRALASIGLAGEEYASADELVTALVQQEEVIQPPKGPNEFEQASKYLFKAIKYTIESRVIGGSLADLKKAMKHIAEAYSPEIARKVKPFADSFEKQLTKEKAIVEAA
jgi:hypothetical protein|tara:strand:+ start:116 stop:718 length:603 start_codon:yes stop_codon:yes gene_type:complete